MNVKKKRKAQNYVKITLILLLLFLSSGGFYGGILLSSDPSGNSLQVPPELLDGLPIRDYLLPGIFLLVFFGILPLIAVYGLIFKRRLWFMEKINPVRNWKWSVTLSFFIGCTLVCWTIGEIILWEPNMLSLVYFGLGIIIVFFSLFAVKEL
ncbi:MAG: hypothetical protein AB9842_10810 [Bacteroidales bacterium]